MPGLHRLLHDVASWQPGRLVETQSVHEFLPDHLHGLFKTLLRKQVKQYRMSGRMQTTAKADISLKVL